jgi:hypothetical protein
VAQRLASLGMEFSEEAVEPVTGYRVDMLLHGGDDGAAGRCAVEVGIYINLVNVVVAIIATSSLLLSKLKRFVFVIILTKVADYSVHECGYSCSTIVDCMP